ncbi:hypothetical protein [Xylella fastidiosa]|uniref:hypothetical protein n=1 Tax=Xylella fastidiosa TaxID=2371 RepID=UPI0002D818C5|nr:hypothetical protein [Xylella fastidiosa]MDG5826198.1 hypothetical protein [Xylella fastidiosa subsp. pauca]WCF21510.1 hypothetical protein OK114_10255 [Xylella fastidiosa subsp. fastidiosa]WGZ31837.1 hypothetical protein O4444_10165 [Xylella fastidiosa subsp. pauca]WNY18916.1 hypothetical protein RO839_10725 [Xylella fastidiosa]
MSILLWLVCLSDVVVDGLVQTFQCQGGVLTHVPGYVADQVRGKSTSSDWL